MHRRGRSHQSSCLCEDMTVSHLQQPLNSGRQRSLPFHIESVFSWNRYTTVLLNVWAQSTETVSQRPLALGLTIVLTWDTIWDTTVSLWWILPYFTFGCFHGNAIQWNWGTEHLKKHEGRSVFVCVFSSNINQLSPESQTLPLSCINWYFGRLRVVQTSWENNMF